MENDADLLSMMRGYKDMDRKNGFKHKEKDYMGLEEVKEMIEKSYGEMCSHETCVEVIGRKAFSTDRCVNAMGHVRGNVRVLCSKRCNSSLK